MSMSLDFWTQWRSQEFGVGGAHTKQRRVRLVQTREKATGWEQISEPSDRLGYRRLPEFLDLFWPKYSNRNLKFL